MAVETLLILLFIGATAGFLGGQIVKGYGFGLVGNVLLGIVGAFVASYLLPKLGLSLAERSLVISYLRRRGDHSYF